MSRPRKTSAALFAFAGVALLGASRLIGSDHSAPSNMIGVIVAIGGLIALLVGLRASCETHFDTTPEGRGPASSGS